MTLEFLQPKRSDARLLKCSAKSASSGPSDAVYLDNDLVRRTRGGDSSASEELFSRHHKAIYNIALRMLEDETEAADATQEVFVRAYQSISKLSSDAAFVTRLETVATNHFRDLLRKRKTLKADSLDAVIEMGDGSRVQPEVADWSGNPEMLLDKKRTYEIVAKAIDSLSPDYREVVTLFYVDGSDVAEIAAIVGSPVGTVKARLSRARTELRRKLEPYLKD